MRVWMAGQSWCFSAIFVSTLLSEKNWRPPEASVPLDCVTWPDTHIHSASLYLQWDCLTQAVHTKNSPAVCLTHTRTSTWMHTHTCAGNTHALPLFWKKFLSVSAATTSVRWAVSTPKGAGWTPVITCLRSSGTQAARWSHSTSRPQVPQHRTHDLWPHTPRSYTVYTHYKHTCIYRYKHSVNALI